MKFVSKSCWQKYDEYHLRRSLRTLVTYADSDSLTEVEGSDFPDQVSVYPMMGVTIIKIV